MESNVKYLELS